MYSLRIDCLRDIKRILRHDDKTEDKLVLRLLGHWKLLQSDLIAILKMKDGNQKLIEAALELMVPLTFPVEQEKPYAHEQSRFIYDHVVAILEADLLNTVFLLLIEPLSLNEADRSTRDLVNIRLLLTLCRNVVRSSQDILEPDDKLQVFIF